MMTPNTTGSMPTETAIGSISGVSRMIWAIDSRNMPVMIRIAAMTMSRTKLLSVKPVRNSPIRNGTSIRLSNSPKALAGPTMMSTAPEIIAVVFRQDRIASQVSSRCTNWPTRKA